MDFEDVRTCDANPKAARILARTLYKELRENGYACGQVIALSTELLELVTQELRSASERPEDERPSA